MLNVVENEEARLNALRNLGLLDTPPSEAFDRITRMSSRLLGAPVSTISLTDSDRQWFKSRFGVDLTEIPREQAPCNYAIRDNIVFLVPDMLEDVRFATSPLANAGIRFYAGAPLVTRSGYGLGTLCVVDVKPRTLDVPEQQMLRDLADMVMSQIELQNTIGRIDPISGLVNEHQFFEDMEDLSRRTPEVMRVGVLIELVSSSQLNDGTRALGAGYAESLIRNSIAAIRKCVDPSTRIYHVGVNRCMVIVDESVNGSWQDIAAKIDDLVKQDFMSEGLPFKLSPSIGVYEFCAGLSKPRDILRKLISASLDARESGALVTAYNEISDLAHARLYALINDVPKALTSDDQFSLVYQPRLDFATGACVSVEALLRWTHPNLGNVPPNEFIPLVETTALARPLTEWVLHAAARDLKQWRNAGFTHRVSINVSARNLEEYDFAERVIAILNQHEVQARDIELEFTESAVARDNATVLRQLNALRELGISLAIDDFGTGYSSFSYLQQLPAKVLKIDRSFVRNLATSQSDQKLVRAMIQMAHDLDYRVVAEGIETAEAYALLKQWNCNEAQGFFISKGVPALQLQDWLGKAKAA